jgi:hyperosmotically inducible periplasmic protein
MKRTKSISIVLLSQASLLGVTLFAIGCGSHPNDKEAVYAALDQKKLGSVMVAENRRSGVLTLTGIVDDGSRKSQAETLAKQAAPGYTVHDQIQVKTTGLEALEKNAPATK